MSHSVLLALPRKLPKKAVKKRSLLTGLLNVDFWNYFFFNIRYLNWGKNRNIFFACHCTKPEHSTLKSKRGFSVRHGIILKFYKKYSVMLLLSPSVTSDSLQPHGQQHTRLSCPSPSLGACLNSCLMSWWCHPTISSSVIPFSSCHQSCPPLGSSEWALHIKWSKYWSFSFPIRLSNAYSRLISFRTDWFDLEVKGDLESFSPIPQFKTINSSVLSLLYSPTLTSIHDHGKNHSLDYTNFVAKVISLLFNMLSRLVIYFLWRSKHLLISQWQSPPAVILEPKKIKSVTVSIVFLSICHQVMGLDAMIFLF